MSDAILSQDVKRLVVVCPSWVGDVVMATPVLRALRQHCHQATIIGVMRPGLDDLLIGTPWLDEMIVADSAGMRSLLRTVKMIRRVKADAGVLLPNSFRSALLLRLAGVRQRIGYKRDGRGVLLTDAIDPPARNAPIPMLDYYAGVAKAALGVDAIDPTMKLAVSEAQRQAAEDLLRGVSEPFIVLNPGANKSAKRWPADRFAAVGDALAASHGVLVVVNGSPREADVIEAVIGASASPGSFINLVQRGVTLGSLKALVQRAALMITNDTGPRHIAAAMGTPLVSLFGPTDHRWTTLANIREHIVLADPFLPEELTADDHAEVCAIDRICVGDVIAAARSVLAE